MLHPHKLRPTRFPAFLLVLTALALVPPGVARGVERRPFPDRVQHPDALGDYVLLSWNDLGMHCMNRLHANFSVLPPYNNLDAQLIRRGDATHLPVIDTTALIAYSIPGNTTSVTKTDFWTCAPALFGVTLPPDVGLTGLGLTGTFARVGPRFRAEGIPVTPFPDATPTVESPYQQALVIASIGGAEVARSNPVIPVSTELSCVSAGCHSSESAILDGHESVNGFNPNARPILCARCHADPVLGTTGRPDAGYFSFRIHDAHKFMDQQFTGTTLCYKCHPGPTARCLRGVMANTFGLACQDCHGSMNTVATSIETGRVPWLQEPACRTCHTSRFGEPIGQLYRQTTGHGGVMCEGCHNSTHSEWPSFLAADNANAVALQGRAAPLSDCRVCHGAVPQAPGPHGIITVDVGTEVLAGAAPLRAWPNPLRESCTLETSARAAGGGRLLIFDAQGRTVRLLHGRAAGGDRARATWDARDQYGVRVGPGTYFARWQDGGAGAACRLTVVR
jgi:hypothetical protein